MEVELKALVVNYGTFYFHHCLVLFLRAFVGLFSWAFLMVVGCLVCFVYISNRLKVFLVFLENTCVFSWEERYNFL